MKQLIYRLIKPNVYSRFKELKRKQEDRMDRLMAAVCLIEKWDDIPKRWLMSDVLEVLNVIPTQASYNFVNRMISDVCRGEFDSSKFVKRLPLN